MSAEAEMWVDDSDEDTKDPQFFDEQQPLDAPPVEEADEDEPIDETQLIAAANFLVDAWSRGDAASFAAVCDDQFYVYAPDFGLDIRGVDAVWQAISNSSVEFKLASLHDHHVNLNESGSGNHVLEALARFADRNSGDILLTDEPTRFIFDADGLLVKLEIEMNESDAEDDDLEEVALWQAATDPNTGKTYYFHAKTGETSWSLPAQMIKAAAADAASEPSTEVPVPTVQLPWREIQDASGKTYYHNVETNETSWTVPIVAESQTAPVDDQSETLADVEPVAVDVTQVEPVHQDSTASLDQIDSVEDVAHDESSQSVTVESECKAIVDDATVQLEDQNESLPSDNVTIDSANDEPRNSSIFNRSVSQDQPEVEPIQSADSEPVSVVEPSAEVQTSEDAVVVDEENFVVESNLPVVDAQLDVEPIQTADAETVSVVEPSAETLLESVQVECAVVVEKQSMDESNVPEEVARDSQPESNSIVCHLAEQSEAPIEVNAAESELADLVEAQDTQVPKEVTLDSQPDSSPNVCHLAVPTEASAEISTESENADLAEAQDIQLKSSPIVCHPAVQSEAPTDESEITDPVETDAKSEIAVAVVESTDNVVEKSESVTAESSTDVSVADQPREELNSTKVIDVSADIKMIDAQTDGLADEKLVASDADAAAVLDCAQVQPEETLASTESVVDLAVKSVASEDNEEAPAAEGEAASTKALSNEDSPVVVINSVEVTLEDQSSVASVCEMPNNESEIQPSEAAPAETDIDLNSSSSALELQLESQKSIQSTADVAILEELQDLQQSVPEASIADVPSESVSVSEGSKIVSVQPETDAVETEEVVNPVNFMSVNVVKPAARLSIRDLKPVEPEKLLSIDAIPSVQPVVQRSVSAPVADKPSFCPWKKTVDKVSGKVYYFNAMTEQTSWTEPDGYFDTDAEAAEVIPAPWRKVTDSSGGVYYHNLETNETSWTVPVESIVRAMLEVEHIPKPWRRVSDGTGSYYHNTETNETSWTLPKSTESKSSITSPVKGPEVKSPEVKSPSNGVQRRKSHPRFQPVGFDELEADEAVVETFHTPTSVKVAEQLDISTDTINAESVAEPETDQAKVSTVVALSNVPEDEAFAGSVSVLSPQAGDQLTSSAPIDYEARLQHLEAQLRAAHAEKAAAQSSNLSESNRSAEISLAKEKELMQAQRRQEREAAALELHTAVAASEAKFQIERSELLSRIAHFEAEAISRQGNEESIALKLKNQLESVQTELESLKQTSCSQMASKDTVIAQLEAKLAAQQIELDRQRALAEDRELAGRQSYQRLQERIEALLSSAESSAPLLMLDSCKRCGTEFREIENGPSACSFHSGKRVTNAVGYRFWSCCLQEYSKSNPAPPCERGRHTAESKTPSA